MWPPNRNAYAQPVVGGMLKLVERWCSHCATGRRLSVLLRLNAPMYGRSLPTASLHSGQRCYSH